MLLRNVFSKYLLNSHLRKCPQTSVIRSFSDSLASTRAKDQQPAHYRDPTFFKHFSTFLTENSLRKHLPQDLWFQYSRALEELEELDEIVQQSSKLVDGETAAPKDNDDADFFELASNEMALTTDKLLHLQEAMLHQVVPDDSDVSECTLEVRAGVGGKEACLFAEELYRLYLKFIAYNGWSVRSYEGDDESETTVTIDESTSLWTASVEVVGRQCYRALRHEAGVHRVQRVPKTEKYGRIHTSTVSLSVLPVRQNLVQIKDSDLKFDVKNSSGAGGQNVNRNLTCVRCTHIPSGHAVEAQETRYQHHNKETAIRKMTTLLNNLEYERLQAEARAERRLQLGSGIASRSDKIRTYNWPQNRITDHRLSGDSGGGGNMFNISAYMSGEECAKMASTIERLEASRQAELVRQVREALEKSFFSKTKRKTISKK